MSRSTALATSNFGRTHRFLYSAVGLNLSGFGVNQMSDQISDGASLAIRTMRKTLVV